MTEPTPFGFDDEALAARPTVYQPRLFAGQVAIVSGAGSGIGKAIAFLYARLGARLVICGRDPAKLESCAEWLRRLGSPDVLVQVTNIREPEQVEQLIDVVWRHFGRVDVLVNNAGGQFPQRALDYSVKGWKAVIDTNLNGTWYMMQALARRWRDTGTQGNIVNIVATFQRGMPGVAHTCAARAAVTYLSKTVAVEWAQYGIRVNCIAPGAIASTGFRQYSPEAVKAFAGANPMKHVGDVQDVAEAVVYLSAPSGKFITGELLTVDGGGVLWGEAWTIAKPDYFKVST
ncbi:SDR family oxidoreductase [Hydrogenophaga pseudoflava]|jgi:citronellol/citronellal dehydrogenase|uniref:Peroxisomal trans-2-enoyl-CoA reductase n=1 Tax=Hydrogenophaga pseudoflava TaxID=47421 RepID=A0A4P6WX98_HYDPS|nr:SDR family oxidoreductase [Hydrogenophaga pseudoflava]MCM2337245.1 SDR family oxidoreductase [Lysobacter sp.]QBM28632.1 putative 2,4-dienoyl-CoA reductase [Hydrogenophaga pseudoflava]